MTGQYAKARDAAERAIREAFRLCPPGEQEALWCSIIDRLSLVDAMEDKRDDP